MARETLPLENSIEGPGSDTEDAAIRGVISPSDEQSCVSERLSSSRTVAAETFASSSSTVHRWLAHGQSDSDRPMAARRSPSRKQPCRHSPSYRFAVRNREQAAAIRTVIAKLADVAVAVCPGADTPTVPVVVSVLPFEALTGGPCGDTPTVPFAVTVFADMAVAVGHRVDALAVHLPVTKLPLVA